MKLSVSLLATGCEKHVDMEDEHKRHTFCDKHMATEITADALGDEYKGCVIWVSDQNNKRGFPMEQTVLAHYRVLLLLWWGSFLL